MKPILFALVLLLFSLNSGLSQETEEVLEDTFEREELGKGWNAQFGEWKLVDGVLRARQVPADNHGAAARRALPMGDGIFEMKFRLVEKGQAFHFGFDPARGELKKRGHLFSVIVSPGRASIKKHVDKDKPKEDPDEILASINYEFGIGKWYTLRVVKKGDDVEAGFVPEGSTETVADLKTSHPTFHVKTPALVFRCIGDGIEVDDIKVRKIGPKTQ